MKKKPIIIIGLFAVALGAAVALGVFRGSPTPVADFKSVTEGKYFGNAATGDVNGDGTADTAFIFTQEPGGSGTFYYVTVALKKDGGWVGTNAVLLGDRIAPQSTQISDGVIIVNYADRKPTDPMTARPSVGMSKYLTVHGRVLSETKAPGGTICTMDAKLCPDGSYVGRHGPKCEFDACPMR